MALIEAYFGSKSVANSVLLTDLTWGKFVLNSTDNGQLHVSIP